MDENQRRVLEWYQLDPDRVYEAILDPDAYTTDSEADMAVHEAFERFVALLESKAWGRVPYRTYTQAMESINGGEQCPARYDPYPGGRKPRCASMSLHPGRHGVEWRGTLYEWTDAESVTTHGPGPRPAPVAERRSTT